MKVLRKIIEIDDELCNGCGQCVPACAEGALVIENGKARMIAEKYCDGLGACLGDCPTGALKIIEREAEDFDEEAVAELLEARQEEKQKEAAPCGCPSAKIQTFAPADPCQGANQPTQLRQVQASVAAAGSALSHWPIQIRLIPPAAPFLKDADLITNLEEKQKDAPSGLDHLQKIIDNSFLTKSGAAIAAKILLP